MSRHQASLEHCPRCGAAEVVHRVYGDLGPDQWLSMPSWMRPMGCVVSSDDFLRECSVCQHQWRRVGDEEDWDSATEF